MANSRDQVLTFVYATTGDKELANTTSLLVKMAENGKLADKETIELTDSLKKLSGQSKAVNDALSQKAGLAETAKQLETAKDAAAALSREFDRTDTSSKKIADAFRASDKAVADLTAQYNKQSVELAKTQGALQKAGVDTQNLAAANAALNAQAASVAQGLARVGVASLNAAASTNAIRAAADKVRDSFKHVAEGVGEFVRKAGEITGITGIISGVVAAVSGFKFFETGAEEAAHFEQALSKLKATSSLTGEQFTALRAKVEAAASALDFTATEGAIAAGKLAQSIGDANKAAAALPATLELAKAAQIDTAAAADIVATALKSFGLQAKDAAAVSDLLAAISVKTGASLSGLASTFSQLAPLAQAIGLSFQDTAVVLGALAQKGIDSEQALGGLRALFEGLRNPASELRQQLVGLGIDTTSLSSIIQGLATAGPAAEAALDSLGNRGKAAILALVQDGGGAIDKFQKQLGDTAGAAKAAGEAIEDNLLDAFKDFGASLANLAGGALSEALSPLKEEVQSLTERIKAIPESAGFQRIKAAIADFVASGVASFESLINSIDFDAVGAKISEFFTSAKTGFDSLKDGFKSFGTVAAGVTDSIAFAFHALEAAIFGSAAAIAKAVEIAGKGLLVLSGQTAQLLDANSQASRILNAFGASAEVNYNRAAAAAELAAKNVSSLGGALDNSADSADSAGEAANSAADGIETADRAAQSATTSLGGTAAAGANAAGALTDLSGAALETARALAQAKYDEAAKNLETLRASSTATADALDKAALAVSAAGLELAKFGPSTKKAKDGIEDLEAAFAGLKIKSQDDLRESAKAAKNFFDLIDKSSAQTAEGLADRKNAFLAYAKVAIDAAADLDQSTKDQLAAQLEARASALGVLDALEKLEQQGLKAGEKIAEGMKEAKEAAQDAGAAIADVGDAASDAGKNQDGYTRSLEGTATAMAGIVAIGPEQAAAMKLLNERLAQSADLTNLSLNEAKYLLSTLGPLAGGAAALIERRINDLTAAAQKATDAANRMADEAAQLQDQIDELEGNDAAVEDRRHQRKLADLAAEAQANGTQNSEAYRKLVELENKLHALKMRNLRDEGKGGSPGAGRAPSPGSSGGGRGGGNNGSGQAPQPDDRPPPRTPAPSAAAPAPSVHVTVQGSVIGGTPAQLAEQLARLVRPELRRIDGRSS